MIPPLLKKKALVNIIFDPLGSAAARMAELVMPPTISERAHCWRGGFLSLALHRNLTNLDSMVRKGVGVDLNKRRFCVQLRSTNVSKMFPPHLLAPFVVRRTIGVSSLSL